MAIYLQWQQEKLFETSGPFIHLYTSPMETDLLMENDEDRTVVLNMIALLSPKSGISILAYALMSNHIHLIIKGTTIQGRDFFESLYRRLSRYLSNRGKAGCIKGFSCGMTEITSLKQFRDELAYVIRNPFVVRDDVHLFSYRWCSGYLYFNSFLSKSAGKTAKELKYRGKRMITRSSSEDIPDGYRIEGSLILPECFVDYHLVEQLFGSARQFLYWTLKNVEAQVLVASAYGESPSLSDDELFVLSRNLCETMFRSRQPKELTHQQKKEFVVALRNQYHASNGQLARLSSLSQSEVDEMYPLTSKQ